MKSALSNLVSVMLLLFLSGVTGCSKEEPVKMPSGATPFWDPSDLEMSKLKEGQSAYQYIVTTKDQPPYYRGPMPLEYRVAYPPWGLPGYAFQSEIPLYFKFPQFTVYFVYQGLTLAGARATDSNRNVVAEARLRYFVSGDQSQGIEAEEVHYDAEGRAIFHCKSAIDANSGHKVNENHKEGKKQRAYFFIWPH